MHRATFYVFFAHRDRYFPPPLPFPLLSLSPAAQVENCWKRRDAAPFRPRQLFYIYRLWLRFGRNWCWKMIGLKSYVFYSRDKVSWEE